MRPISKTAFFCLPFILLPLHAGATVIRVDAGGGGYRLPTGVGAGEFSSFRFLVSPNPSRGDIRFAWSRPSRSRKPLPPGIYFIRYDDGERTENRKVIPVR